MVYQSRAATFYANTSYAGLHNQAIWISIAGSADVAHLIDLSTLVIELHARQPSIAEFRVMKGSAAAPRPGHDVEIRNGGAEGALIFAGTVVSRQIVTTGERHDTSDLVMCMDYTWLLDRWKFVNKKYTDRPFTAIVHDLVDNFTDPNSNFVPGLVEATGSISMFFETQRVSECLRRMAACTSTIVSITPKREVSLLSIGGTSTSIGASADEFMTLEIEEDITQTRTRTFVEGEGSQLDANYTIDQTEMTLNTTEWADASGGSGVLRGVVFTYTGKTLTTLTGVSGAVRGYTGDAVNLVSQADDATGQTNLSTTLGGSQSGVVEFYIRDRSQTQAEADARASDELIAGPLGAVQTASFTTRTRTFRPGQHVVFSATQIGDNRFFSGTIEIDVVRLQAVGDDFQDDLQPDFFYTVQCTPVRTNLSRILSRSIEIR